MRKRKLASILSVAIVLAIAGVSFGLSSYLSQFNTRYGTSGTALNSCSLCHPGGATSQLNPYGSDYGAHAHDYAAIEALDSDGDGYSNLAEINARTLPGDSASHPVSDAIPPVVTAFSIPATANYLTVTINTFTATDNTGVTGYLVTGTSTKPLSSDAGWNSVRPTSYTFTSAGAKTLYAWAKDAAGNVSTTVVSASVTVTVTDTAPPVVTSFVVPASSGALTVPVTSFTATDNVGVTGYIITLSSMAPAITDAGWTATAPTSYSFATVGAKTLYAWAKDAAGNVSAGVPQTVLPLRRGIQPRPLSLPFLSLSYRRLSKYQSSDSPQLMIWPWQVIW